MTATMPRFIYRQKPTDNLNNVKVTDVNAQLATTYGTGGGRSLFYLQWALFESGRYTGLVDGVMSAATQDALDLVRGEAYGVPEYAPYTGPTVSLAFLKALFADYLYAGTYPPVVAS